jgi:hypothetical protein
MENVPEQMKRPTPFDKSQGKPFGYAQSKLWSGATHLMIRSFDKLMMARKIESQDHHSEHVERSKEERNKVRGLVFYEK